MLLLRCLMSVILSGLNEYIYLSHFFFQMKAGSTLFGNVTAGRLIRVPIQCRHDNATVAPTSSCIVFMVHGTVECKNVK